MFLAGLGVAATGIVVFSPQTARTLFEKAGAATLASLLAPPLPEATEIMEAHWLEQSWSDRDRFWFHHTSQGTATLPVPYDWFVTFERPELSPFTTPGRLADIDYLQRFGFIPSTPPPKSAPEAAAPSQRERYTDQPGNPDGLPVGLARMAEGIDLATRAKFPPQIGVTCAACHTGHLEYNKVSLRFDGGPAMTHLGRLEDATVLALLYTLKVPGRFDRFAERLARRTPEWPAWKDKASLEKEMQATLDRILILKRWVAQSSRTPPVEEGFGRLDALNRAGNLVFFTALLPNDILAKDPRDPATRHVPPHIAANFAPITAPVSFPPLWDVPHFLWAQYDGSILNALVRNAGEALGAGAMIDITDLDPARRFRSSLPIGNMVAFESLIAGSDPLARRSFDGLAAPRWSDAAKLFEGDANWKIDPAKVERGRQVYRAFCVECHRGPVRDPEFDRLWPDYSFWNERSPDRRDPNWVRFGDRNYFNVVEKTVAGMGTDPEQSKVLAYRKVTLPAALDFDPVRILSEQKDCDLAGRNDLDTVFGVALMAVVGRSVDKWFAENPTDAETEKKMRGPRPNCPNQRTFTPSGKIVPHYRARPHDGVWATAPYLHNGSVPTLHAMLVPQRERPRAFCVGSRQFDPRNVGLKLEPLPCATGLTTVDTTELGSSNLGHSFEGTETDVTKLPPGVIGRELTPDERDNLIEYLKTL